MTREFLNKGGDLADEFEHSPNWTRKSAWLEPRQQNS